MVIDQAAASAIPATYREEYNGKGPLAVAIVFIVLEVSCTALRFWARRIGRVAWGADDSLIIPSAIFCLAVIGCGLGDIHYGGVGYHEAVVVTTSPLKLITWAKYTLIIPMVYLPAVVLPKLSILVMYLRVFTKKSDRITCWVIATLMIANCAGTIIAGFFICTPLEFLRNRKLPGGHCININAWYRWSSLMNIITDVVMLILPLPVVWKIQTSTKIKIGLTITFATGSSGLITSIIRFSGFFTQDMAADGTWSASKLIILTIIESGVYLIAACLPTYRPLAIFLWSKSPLSSLHRNPPVSKSPLSSLRLGSTGHKPGTSKGRNGAYEIPRESRLKNGFSRLQPDTRSSVPHRHTMDDERGGEP